MRGAVESRINMKESPMKRSIKTTALAAAIAFTGIAGVAQADNPKPVGDQSADVTIKPNGFSPISVDVISEDGKKWTKVKSKKLLLKVTVGVGKTDQYVRGINIRQGWLSQTSEQPWLLSRSFGKNLVRYDSNEVISGSTDNFTPAERTSFIKACNAKLDKGGSIKKSYKLFSGVKLQIRASFTSDGQIDLGSLDSVFSNGKATVAVNCKGVKNAAGGFAAEQPKNLKVKSVQLFRTTYSNAYSQPNPGVKCKKARLLVRLKTNKAGPVKFRLWTKIGNKPMSSKLVETWSNFSGPGEFKAEYKEWVSVNKTSFVQARAEELINPIGMSTAWKSITLHCTGAGGGGLADVPANNPDDVPAVAALKVTGNLTLADKANAPKDRPRLGAAVFKIWATKPGPTSYQLTCSGGRKWTGTLPTFKITNKKYQAVGLRNFQIAKTEKLSCALRSTSMPKNNLIALATRQFNLVKRNPKLGGPGKLKRKATTAGKIKRTKKMKARNNIKRRKLTISN